MDFMSAKKNNRQVNKNLKVEKEKGNLAEPALISAVIGSPAETFL